MCGIFGWVGHSKIETERIRNALSEILVHRGPDDSGFEHGANWGAGFRRLSILDLSSLGHQPMRSSDNRYWLVFNGEIYNYIELRQKLEQTGERFRSGSDTEVLLRLLQIYGSEALPMLNGMFALAFFDTVEGRFLLARDRMGQKPLYYLQQNGHMRFASELKALLAWPDAPKEINPIAVNEYLAMTYLSNDTCIFSGYKKLPPAHYMVGSLAAPENAVISRFWNLSINDEPGQDGISADQLEEFSELISDATRIRLRSDVPIGIFLSGGLDSGVVASLAGQITGDNKPLALTVGFEESSFDESALAREVAHQAGLEHELIMQRSNGLDDIDRLAWVYDEPFGDSSALPTMAICEAASKRGTVFLSGDGGDEALGGYSRYIKTQGYKWLKHSPEMLNRGLRGAAGHLPMLSSMRFKLSKIASPNLGFAAAFDETPSDPVLGHILGAAVKDNLHQSADPLWSRWHQTANQNNLLSRQQMLDYRLYLPDDILVKMDRASMASSIEVRSPFLDHRLVEWCSRLPRNKLINGNQGKMPLRLLGNKLLPPSVTSAKKQGFGVPVGDWFSQPKGQNLLKERLLSQEALARGFWDRSAVSDLIENQKQPSRERDLGTWLWRLLILDAWARQYLDSDDFKVGAPTKHLTPEVI